MSEQRFAPDLTKQDKVRVEDKLRGALEMVRKDAHLGALLAIREALSILEGAVAVDTLEDGGEEHGDRTER